MVVKLPNIDEDSENILWLKRKDKENKIVDEISNSLESIPHDFILTGIIGEDGTISLSDIKCFDDNEDYSLDTFYSKYLSKDNMFTKDSQIDVELLPEIKKMFNIDYFPVDIIILGEREDGSYICGMLLKKGEQK